MARLMLLTFSLIAVGLFVAGGCPAQNVLDTEDGLTDDPNSGTSSPDDSSDDEPDNGGDEARQQQLADIVLGLAADQPGVETALSYGSRSIQLAPDFPYDDLYRPDDPNADDDSDADADDDNGSDTGDDEGDSGSTAGAAIISYSGGVACTRHESLIGYGEITEDLTYALRLRFDANGALTGVYLPAFVAGQLVRVDVSYAGDADTVSVVLSDDVTHTLRASVSYAFYTAGQADVTIQLEQTWNGPHASVVAYGSHTLHVERTVSSLTYESQTQYDADFVAADGWEGSGIEAYAISGTLRVD